MHESLKSRDGAVVGAVFGIAWAAILIASFIHKVGTFDPAMLLFLIFIPVGGYYGYDSGKRGAVFMGVAMIVIIGIIFGLQFWWK